MCVFQYMYEGVILTTSNKRFWSCWLELCPILLCPCKIVCHFLSLSGLTLESVDKGMNGCVVKTVAPGGAVAKDGRIQVGDYVVTINNETLRRITNAQARAILRRASLLGSDIRYSTFNRGQHWETLYHSVSHAMNTMNTITGSNISLQLMDAV